MKPTREQMRLTAAAAERPRQAVAAARLLAGLIALTALFLVVMGVVTPVVLGTLDRTSSTPR